MVAVRSTTIRKDGSIFIPTGIFQSVFKVKITCSDGTVYNIDDPYLTYIRINHMSLREGISSADIEAINDHGVWNSIVGGEDIEIYHDRTDGTAIRFKGKVDYTIKSLNESDGYKIRFVCRNNPILSDDKIDLILDNASLQSALIGVNGASDVDGNKEDGVLYNSGIKLYFYNSTTGNFIQNVVSGNATSILFNLPLRDVTRSDAIKQLLEKASCNAYIDYSTNRLKMMNLDDVTNVNEYVAYGENLESVDEYFTDNLELRNRIKIVGASAEVSDIPYMKTEEDIPSQINLWRKTEVIYDNSITSMEEIQDRANKELTYKSVAPSKGSLKVIGGLISTNPGEKIKISIPYIIDDDYYRVSSITDIMGPDSVSSIIKIGKESTTVLHLLQDINKKNSNLQQYNNPYRLEHSWVVTFAEAGSLFQHAGTKIKDNSLLLSGTSTTGSCIIGPYVADNSVKLAEIRTNSQDISASNIQMRVNNGAWTMFAGSTTGSLTPPNIGNSIDLMVNLASGTQVPVPSIWTLGVLYK